MQNKRFYVIYIKSKNMFLQNFQVMLKADLTSWVLKQNKSDKSSNKREKMFQVCIVLMSKKKTFYNESDISRRFKKAFKMLKKVFLYSSPSVEIKCMHYFELQELFTEVFRLRFKYSRISFHQKSQILIS